MSDAQPNSEPNSARYIAIIDVPADVAGSVLAELAREGIAAFAEPIEPRDTDLQQPALTDQETTGVAQQPPARRIHVDRARIPAARAVIASRLPEVGTGFLAATTSTGPALTTEQVDAAWAQLVTEWETPDAGPIGGSGLSSRLIRRQDSHPHSPPPPTPPSHEGRDPEDTQTTPVGGGPRDYSFADIDELDSPDEGFVPPEPPPLPRPRHALDTIGWSAVIGGPALLVANQVLSWGTWVSGVGVAGFMGGFVILVSRMRNERDHDDPGAVV